MKSFEVSFFAKGGSWVYLSLHSLCLDSVSHYTIWDLKSKDPPKQSHFLFSLLNIVKIIGFLKSYFFITPCQKIQTWYLHSSSIAVPAHTPLLVSTYHSFSSDSLLPSGPHHAHSVGIHSKGTGLRVRKYGFLTLLLWTVCVNLGLSFNSSGLQVEY